MCKLGTAVHIFKKLSVRISPRGKGRVCLRNGTPPGFRLFIILSDSKCTACVVLCDVIVATSSPINTNRGDPTYKRIPPEGGGYQKICSPGEGNSWPAFCGDLENQSRVRCLLREPRCSPWCFFQNLACLIFLSKKDVRYAAAQK